MAAKVAKGDIMVVGAAEVEATGLAERIGCMGVRGTRLMALADVACLRKGQEKKKSINK